jgi:phosphoribosylglycinamide formyltransferase-1
VALALAILASHAGSTAGAVLDAFAAGEIEGHAVLVLSNNSDSGALARARAAGVPTAHLSSRTHPRERALDAAILEAVRGVRATHLLLAGYMKRLGPLTLAAYERRVYNTHPALLPDFGGAGMYGDRVHEAVLRSGRSESGATVHVVTEEYDAGPILAQVRVPVLDGDVVATLGERVRAAERALIVSVLAELSHAARG